MASVHNKIYKKDHGDMFMGYGDLVKFLVLAHLAAFALWVIMLAWPRKQLGDNTIHQKEYKQTEHQKEVFQEWEMFAFALVGLHFVAFAYWCYLLLFSARRKPKQASTFKTLERKDNWRTPGDIMASFCGGQGA